MAARRSKSRVEDTDGTQVDAPEVPNNNASHTTSSKGSNMSDMSIIEFSEDVSSQDAIPPLPKGDYPFEIKGATAKESQTSGKPYGSLQLFIAPEAYPADYTDGEPDGTMLMFNRVPLEDTPAQRYRLRKVSAALGAPAIGRKLDLNDWIGLTGIVTIDHETYEGELRAVAKRIIAA